MTSTRPYLLRAIYDWIVDNGMTPHILVDTSVSEVEVPEQHIENNKIVLNINPSAVQDLEIGNEYLSFSARFSGKAEYILSPVNAVLAIYAKENAQGMMFADEESDLTPEINTTIPVQPEEQQSKKAPVHLKVVK